MQMDLEEFLSLAEGYRKADKASVKNRPIGEIYEQMKYSTSPLKFTVMNDEVFVAIDGLSRSLMSY